MRQPIRARCFCYCTLSEKALCTRFLFTIALGNLIAMTCAAMFADILAWFPTKWDPVYAFVVVIGGGLLGVSLIAQVLVSLWQLRRLRASEPK